MRPNLAPSALWRVGGCSLRCRDAQRVAGVGVRSLQTKVNRVSGRRRARGEQRAPRGAHRGSAAVARAPSHGHMRADGAVSLQPPVRQAPPVRPCPAPRRTRAGGGGAAAAGAQRGGSWLRNASRAHARAPVHTAVRQLSAQQLAVQTCFNRVTAVKTMPCAIALCVKGGSGIACTGLRTTAGHALQPATPAAGLRAAAAGSAAGGRAAGSH